MFDSPSGADPGKAGQLLQDLGLTATEAAVYCTALQSCAQEPVSSYKLARTMGRDPANVAKTLSSLVRLQAMTVVQDKPRLYLPTDPAEFTERVLSRLRHSGDEAVDLLRQFPISQPAGVTLALSGTEAVFDRARALLLSCERKAIVFGAKESLREVGAELEALAEKEDCRVQVLSPLAMISDRVEIAVFSPLSELSNLLERDFLHLVIDDQAWLSAMLSGESGPRGWWGDQVPMATVLGGALSLAWQSGHSAQAVATSHVPDAEPESMPEPVPEPRPEPIPPEPEPKPEFEEGLTFLIKHEPATDKEKGEP